MKDFSITRIPNNDLIGLLFPPLVSLSEYEIEVIHPEYVDGYRLASSDGSPVELADYCYGIADVSKYDYVLVPLVAKSGALYSSGLNEIGVGETFSRNTFNARTYDSIVASYALLKCGANYKTAVITSLSDYKLPVIGLRRHRSDNVNPRSPQRPELEPIEIRERQESEPEPVPEIEEADVEETTEEE